MKKKFRVRLCFSLMLLLVLLIDGISKAWAEQTLVLYQPIPIIGQFLQLTLNYNTGIAFGLFANRGSWPIIFTGFVILGLVIWLLQLLRRGEFPVQTASPIGLFVGGAVANFVDRLPDGRVTDFLDVSVGAIRWPTFNLADSFIVLGVTVLMLMTMKEQRQLEIKP
ncbi:MAG: signal peptidase II [Chloroflexi bacterium]|nr:MAG: signal peptidase II [Chloroflexota bacterium]MBL1197376.1 signal peptidase II [Chloroflexota bacterium]NOH14672.1 signal peptidase II [Chloroflexota bacterium]